jgi:tetratricopeptide (TPR) repeat protein
MDSTPALPASTDSARQPVFGGSGSNYSAVGDDRPRNPFGRSGRGRPPVPASRSPSVSAQQGAYGSGAQPGMHSWRERDAENSTYEERLSVRERADQVTRAIEMSTQNVHRQAAAIASNARVTATDVSNHECNRPAHSLVQQLGRQRLQGPQPEEQQSPHQNQNQQAQNCEQQPFSVQSAPPKAAVLRLDEGPSDMEIPRQSLSRIDGSEIEGISVVDADADADEGGEERVEAAAVNAGAMSTDLSELIRLEGRECERGGDMQLARELYRRAVELNNANGKAWQDMAKVEGRIRGGLRRSSVVLRRALEANPTNAYLWQSLGFLEYRMGQHQTARDMFQAGLECDRTHAPIYSTWGRMEGMIGNVSRARELFEQGAAADPSCARLFYTWGSMELNLGNTGRADELFQAGLEIEPDNNFIWQTLGTMAVEAGRYDHARSCFQRALTDDKSNVAVLDHWGRLEARLGNYQQAAELFADGANSSPYDSRILQSWSHMELQRKDIARARQLVQRAVSISTRDSILWCQFAKIECAFGNIPRARALYKRGSEVNPQDWMVWDSWSAMEHNLGNAVEAAQLLQRSFAIRFSAKGDFTILSLVIDDDHKKQIGKRGYGNSHF